MLKVLERLPKAKGFDQVKGLCHQSHWVEIAVTTEKAKRSDRE